MDRYRNPRCDETISAFSQYLGAYRQNHDEYRSRLYALRTIEGIPDPQRPLYPDGHHRHPKIRIPLLRGRDRTRSNPITHHLWSIGHDLNHADFSRDFGWPHGKKPDSPRAAALAAETAEIWGGIGYYCERQCFAKSGSDSVLLSPNSFSVNDAETQIGTVWFLYHVASTINPAAPRLSIAALAGK